MLSKAICARHFWSTRSARHVSRRYTSARKSRARLSRRQRALCDPLHGDRWQWEV